ncbi:MAG: SMC family ATPase [Gemmatimonadaceae bacterium]
MRLNALHLCNFRQHADTRLTFDTGLTGIIGANGSGKTTILEAIAWAIYGNPAARGTRDSIRFSRAGARASVKVELDFDLGGHRYRVVRGLTSAELYLDGADAPIANSISGVTDLLQRRLGMSREEFFNTYFTGQKELSVMAAMSPSQRAQFLSHVLGYDRLRLAQQILRDGRSTLVARIGGLRQGMPDADAVERSRSEAEIRLAGARERAGVALQRRAGSTTTLALLAPRWESAQREREALLALVAEIKLAESEEAAHTRDADRLARELAEIATASAERAALETELAPFGGLAAEIQRLDALAREEGRRQTLAETRVALADELARLRERRSRIESAPTLEEETSAALEAKRIELEDVDGQLEARRTEWVRDRQEAETKRQALRDQYADLKQQRDRLAAAGAAGACPTCMRPLEEHLAAVLELLDGQIETVRVDGKYYNARLEQLLEMPDELKSLDARRRDVFQEVSALERRTIKVQVAVQELAQVTGEIEKKDARFALLERELDAIPAGYDADRHATVRREIERLSPLDARAARLSAQVEREPHLQQERERVVVTLTAARNRRTALERDRGRFGVRESDYAELRESFERASAEARAAELALVTAEGDVSAAVAAGDSAERAARDLAERQLALGQLTADKRLHDELDRAYTDLRTDLNFQLRPELSELASGFLSDLTEGRYAELELDDAFNIVVLEDGTPKPVISGGEEDLANLVLRLAISQMIAERAGQPFSLLILDEIFGSLDELRRGSVLELLRHLHDRFEQVILITHIDAVRDSLDNVITVRFDERSGASVVEQRELGDGDDAAGDGDLGAAPELFERAGAGD